MGCAQNIHTIDYGYQYLKYKIYRQEGSMQLCTGPAKYTSNIFLSVSLSLSLAFAQRLSAEDADSPKLDGRRFELELVWQGMEVPSNFRERCVVQFRACMRTYARKEIRY